MNPHRTKILCAMLEVSVFVGAVGCVFTLAGYPVWMFPTIWGAIGAVWCVRELRR